MARHRAPVSGPSEPPSSTLAANPAHPVPREHPRVLGSRQHLQKLARQRAEAYRRTVEVARSKKAGDHEKIFSLALVCAIEQDGELGARAVELAGKYIRGPVRVGHETFGHDLALCALAYDLCHASWSGAERAGFHEYMNKTVDANADSETHVFHNGYYGYKYWGIGLACYATMHENPRAGTILHALHADVQARANPALEFAGAGGGWAEGYYIHYFLYEWLIFCEAARHCEGLDYHALAPKFFRQRAVASMFEMYPGVRDHGLHQPIPMGDYGSKRFHWHRDKIIAARRILVNRYRDDPAHRAVHVFNERSPRAAEPSAAYKDFLWRDPSIPRGELNDFKLSHYSPGPGYVYARSSWDGDATYFFFKCGDRFTAHQHLDVGHFLIHKHEELASDGGHFDSWTGPHALNYYIRTIAHNTMLIHDPEETFRGIRKEPKQANDGGQHFPWVEHHHNGASFDMPDWQRNRGQFHIAEMLAFEDRGAYLYVAGDGTRAYSPKKIEFFTRQIVFLRPGTFVIFDRVKSKNPSFKKTWLLQAMKKPAGTAPKLVVTNGRGRLFIQTLLPKNATVRLAGGAELYRYGGRNYPPQQDTGPAPECRVEVSPGKPAAVDYFLHVLTATGASVQAVPDAKVQAGEREIVLTLGAAKITFASAAVGGRIEIARAGGALRAELAAGIRTGRGSQQE